MLRSQYIPHTIYSIAIVSLSIHLVNQRRTSSEERSRINAQLSILEPLTARFRSSTSSASIPTTEEVERLLKLARAGRNLHESIGGAGTTVVNKDEVIGWKEVMFGRKSSGELTPWEKKDLEESKSFVSFLSQTLARRLKY
ncbi:hypothetical protein BDN72DRAFT_812589 [Pluteus cervinus]|uniref:Uncharacterized protein n=1 Tax=Pluteus cervinus TaxID=181527 RepID=A0ACD3BAJ8_9AGAR|nr:hypothetical protein BDN72DRAFT_812589 [Pluteus cervinus]